MDMNNSRTLLIRAAGFLGAASLSALISLPALSQQSPNNSNPNVPSTATPTNPASRDAGTTNGGEDLNRVPGSGADPAIRLAARADVLRSALWFWHVTAGGEFERPEYCTGAISRSVWV